MAEKARNHYRQVSRPNALTPLTPLARDTWIVSRMEVTTGVVYEAWEVCNGRTHEFGTTLWLDKHGFDDWLGRVGTKFLVDSTAKATDEDLALDLITEAFPEIQGFDPRKISINDGVVVVRVRP